MTARIAHEDFESAKRIVGGEGRLDPLFTKLGAHSVGAQAAVCSNIAAGIPLSELKSSARGLGFSIEQLESAKSKLATLLGGKPALVSFLKAHGGFRVERQWAAVTAELQRRSVSTSPAKMTTAPPGAPGHSQPIAIGNGSVSHAKAVSAPSVFVAAKELHGRERALKAFRVDNSTVVDATRTTSAAPTPARPAASRSAPSSKAIPEGALDLAAARALTKEVFGFAPVASSGQNIKSQWLDLESVYHQAGHAAPWADSRHCKSVRQLHADDPAWRSRAAKIKKFFPDN